MMILMNGNMPLWSSCAQQFSERLSSDPSKSLFLPLQDLDLVHGSQFFLVECVDGCTIAFRSILLSSVRKDCLVELARMMGFHNTNPGSLYLLTSVSIGIWFKFLKHVRPLKVLPITAFAVNPAKTAQRFSKVAQQHHAAPALSPAAPARRLQQPQPLPPTPEKANTSSKERGGPAVVSVEQHSKAKGTSTKDSSSASKMGDVIVLKQGQGEKRVYTGDKATITAYPKDGDEMTVFVRSKKLKWSKKDYGLPLPELQDRTWSYIFRFLGSPQDKQPTDQEELLVVRDAIGIHNQLASVCHLWRGICAQNLSSILGRLNVDLASLKIETIVPSIQWLCKHKLKIGKLIIHDDAELEDLPLLAELLTTCDTTELITVRAYVDKEYRRWIYKSSKWISAAYNARVKERYFDLSKDTVSVPLATKALTLGLPTHDLTQMDFHDLLAQQCPKLTNLILSITMPVGLERIPCSEYLSSALFSMPTIVKLEVSIGCHADARPDMPINGMVFTKMIKNLSGLTDLTIKSPDHKALIGKRFSVVSQSLKYVDATRLGKGVWCAFDCPKLERFECKSSDFGCGSAPLILDAGFEDLGFFTERYVNGGKLVVKAGVVPFVATAVPDACVCVIEDFDNYSMRRESMMSLVKACRAASFDHW